MAAKKKTRPAARKSKKTSGPPARKSKKKKSPPRRAKRRAHLKAPRAAAAPAELKELDSEWRSFITKTVPDEPLTEVWKAPKGTPSSKAAIRKATAKKRRAKKTVKKRATGGARSKAPKKKAARN